MFMWGPAPIRRTLDYLKSGKFIAKGRYIKYKINLYYENEILINNQINS